MGTPDRKKSIRVLLLLVGNLIALPILSFPAFGFIQYMDLAGIQKYIAVGWISTIATAVIVWPRAARERGLVTYLLVLLAAYLSAVLAWGLSLHKLFAHPGLYSIWKWVESAILVGGLSTAGYWLPASIINFLALRAKAN